MRDCGHLCCAIPDNDYHRHVDPPGRCPRCARSSPADERVAVGDVVADVVTRVAPEIPDLPEGHELVHLVICVTLSVYAAAIVDPEVQALDAGERRTVLAARVGMLLAFPDG